MLTSLTEKSPNRTTAKLAKAICIPTLNLDIVYDKEDIGNPSFLIESKAS